jgi:hypothetical protein
VVVGGALSHHEHAECLLLAVAGNRTAGRAGRLQLRLQAAGGLLGLSLLPRHPLELGLEVGELGGQTRVPARAGGRAPTAPALELSAELVVFLDQTGELALDLI